MKPTGWNKSSWARRFNLEQCIPKSDAERDGDPHTKAAEWSSAIPRAYWRNTPKRTRARAVSAKDALAPGSRT
jgi:hypothetical protein